VVVHDANAATAAYVRWMLSAELIGSDTEVPCVDGRMRRYVNLDNAASTSALAEVWEAVEGFLPWYSSVHRGSGAKSQMATAAFEGARDAVTSFVGGRASDTTVFVRNTTEAINVLAAGLRPGSHVLTTPVEHHSNMLPWRRHHVSTLPFCASADELVAACDEALRTASPPVELVAVTGASNVTGEVWPLAELASVAHRHGARLFVDAAQLAPHRPLDMAATGIDFLALSGHKLYAPFGAGALVGDAGLLEELPLLQGGGAIRWVTLDDVVWAEAPERHEAGSPNLLGAVALAAACRYLSELGMDSVAETERALFARLLDGLGKVPGLETLTLWPEGSVDRVGVVAFNLAPYRDPLLAAVLSAEYAIGVRNGCFCAQPLIVRLLGIPGERVARIVRELRAGLRPTLPGAVRASLGLGSTRADVDLLVSALTEVAAFGPRARYEHEPDRDEYRPAGLPELLPHLRSVPSGASAA